MTADTKSFATVSRVQHRLERLLEPALSAKPFWLRAELSSVSHSNGRLYCDLVETQGGRVVAKLRCTVWPTELSAMLAKLKGAQLDDLLHDGNEVGLKCQIQYHPLYGLSVNAVDIDPKESLGALERKRLEIVERLRKANLLAKNKERHVPLLPQRIGLVASRNTAGYKDFVTTIVRSGYGMVVYAADARVEGAETQNSVLRALTRLEELDLDLVVVLRGGGSRVSLSYLDNEAIARAIANYKYAVWTGIGHEIDTSVLDAVAHTSFKTPTAVAENLVARYTAAEERLSSATKELRVYATQRLRPERERLMDARGRIRSLARRGANERRTAMDRDANAFRLLVQRRLAGEDARLRDGRGQLRSLARQRTVVAEHALKEHRKSLHKTVSRSLVRHQEGVSRLRQRIRSPVTLNRLRAELARVQAWHQVVRAADPARAVERGYALAFLSDGTLLRSVQSVQTDDAVRVQLADGVLDTKVVAQTKATLQTPIVQIDESGEIDESGDRV